MKVSNQTYNKEVAKTQLNYLLQINKQKPDQTSPASRSIKYTSKIDPFNEKSH